MPSLSSPLLLSPAEEGVRSIVRVLLSGLARAPRVQAPLFYVGPIPREAALVSAVRETSAWDTAGRIAVAPLSDLPRVLDALREAGPGAATRWVVWGRDAPERLGDEMVAIRAAGGRVLDPRVSAVPGPPSALRDALAEATTLVVGIALPGALPLRASEAQLHLEVLGYAPVWVAHDPPATAALPGGPRPALVLCSGQPVPAALALARRAAGAGVARVAVVTRESAAAWRAEFPDARVVKLDPGEATPEPRDVEWPPMNLPLLGATPDPGERAPLFHAPAGARLLHEILQTAEVWGQDGCFVLYTERAAGWIGVRGGQVWAARRVGDAEPADAATISARIRSMALWNRCRVAFVASRADGESQGDARLPAHMVGLDARRALEERDRGILPAGSLAPTIPELGAHAVARELARWGLDRYAEELLDDVERAGGSSPEDELARAYLAVRHDPAEALARLQRALGRLDARADPARGALRVDATLDAMILDARLHPTRAAGVWAVVERWLQEAGEGWASSAHAALLAELALRAGNLPRAAGFAARVVREVPPGDPLAVAIAGLAPALHGGPES